MSELRFRPTWWAEGMPVVLSLVQPSCSLNVGIRPCQDVEAFLCSGTEIPSLPLSFPFPAILVSLLFFFLSDFTMQDPCYNPFPFSCVSLPVLNRRLSQFSYKCLSLTFLCLFAFGLSCDLHLGSLTGDWQTSVWCWSTAPVTLSSTGQPVLTLDFDPWRLQLIALKLSPNKANICSAGKE